MAGREANACETTLGAFLAKIRVTIISKCRHMYGVLNVDKIKN
jgi:hypothetical protein